MRRFLVVALLGVATALAGCNSSSSGGGSGGGSDQKAGGSTDGLPSVFVLNDTGIDWCANSDSSDNVWLSCPIADHPGQDAELGRDAEARARTLQKTGAGAAGFDFTKLNAEGNAVPAASVLWDCVRDNHTGLVWEVKTIDGGLRDTHNTYTWYNPAAGRNGGDPGTANGGICGMADGCDTQGYVAAVNEIALCGFSDWRLPSRLELDSIRHFGRVRTFPLIDVDYFPNTRSQYWSAAPFAGDATKAWTIDFSGTGADTVPKSEAQSVRLVRSGR